MNSVLRKLVPLEARTRLKWAGYALKDIFIPISATRVPPRRRTFIGGGDFETVGNAFLNTLIRHGLQPGMTVLDVGCGQGRMARPLVEYMSEEGAYTGFDIVGDGIQWCQTQYAGVENFTFIHADVFNKRYNKPGRFEAKDYRFPLRDAQFDLTFLTSVFTHMFAADVDNYLSEIARTLKPGGASLITWFLLNPESLRTTNERFQFVHKVDEVSRTTVAKNPEAAIAFDEKYVRQLYEGYGLDIVDIEYGKWGHPDSPYDLQDMIIAKKL